MFALEGPYKGDREKSGEELARRLNSTIDTESEEYRAFKSLFPDSKGTMDIFLRIPHGIQISYNCSSIFEMLELEFTKMLEYGLKLRKCKRCGKFFLMKGNYDTNYCDRIEEGEKRTCKEIAAQENYKAKAAENVALTTYSKYYKRYAARVRVRQIKEAEFKKWKYAALSKRDDCMDGKITIEEFTEWLEACFPNRKPKNKKKQNRKKPL